MSWNIPAKPNIWVTGTEFDPINQRKYGIYGHTVDGWNPKQPPGMYKTLQIMRYLPYQLVSRISAINSSHICVGYFSWIVYSPLRLFVGFFNYILYQVNREFGPFCKKGDQWTLSLRLGWNREHFLATHLQKSSTRCLEVWRGRLNPPDTFERLHPPKFNSLPLKMVVGRGSFPIGKVTFQGRAVKLPGCRSTKLGVFQETRKSRSLGSR